MVCSSKVPPQFEVVGDVVQLSFRFFDVVFQAEHNRCGPLISRLDNDVLPLPEACPIGFVVCGHVSELCVAVIWSRNVFKVEVSCLIELPSQRPCKYQPGVHLQLRKLHLDHPQMKFCTKPCQWSPCLFAPQPCTS